MLSCLTINETKKNEVLVEWNALYWNTRKGQLPLGIVYSKRPGHARLTGYSGWLTLHKIRLSFLLKNAVKRFFFRTVFVAP